MKGKSDFKAKMIADKLEAQKKAQEASRAAKEVEAAKFQKVLDMSYNTRNYIIKKTVEEVGFNPYSNRVIKPLKKALENKYFDIVDIKVRNGAFCTTELVIDIWVWDGDDDSDMTEYHIFNFG